MEAKIIADSINEQGVRITTFVLTYHRFFHSEVMTHRKFSRNAASSRAIPSQKMIEDVMNNPAIPIFWGKNKKGMQAIEELDDVIVKDFINQFNIENNYALHALINTTENSDALFDSKVTDKKRALQIWNFAKNSSIAFSKALSFLGLHKQIANRVMEPFMNIKIIVTATDYENFFALRAHEDAQPEFRHLATMMLNEYNNSIPKKLHYGDWHIPFGENISDEKILNETLPYFTQKYPSHNLFDPITDIKKMIATARCARISYLNFEGSDDYNKDIDLCINLSESGHYSPFEHVAQAFDITESVYAGKIKTINLITNGNEQILKNKLIDFFDDFTSSLSNFHYSWKQYRKFFDNENRKDSRIITNNN